MASGAYSDAADLFGRALIEVERTARPDPRAIVHLLNDVGVACKFAGRFDEAEDAYSRAIRLVDESGKRDTDDMAALLHNVGGLAHARQRHVDGVGPAREGLVLRERLHGPDDPSVAEDVSALAALLEGVGETEEAEHLYRRALAVLDGVGDVRHAALTRNGLGSVCQSLGRHDEAERQYRAALAQLEEAVGPDHPDLGQVLNNLATLHRRRGEDTEARALLARAHELLLRTLGPDHPVTLEVAGNRQRVDATPSPYV